MNTAILSPNGGLDRDRFTRCPRTSWVKRWSSRVRGSFGRTKPAQNDPAQAGWAVQDLQDVTPDMIGAAVDGAMERRRGANSHRMCPKARRMEVAGSTRRD